MADWFELYFKDGTDAGISLCQRNLSRCLFSVYILPFVLRQKKMPLSLVFLCFPVSQFYRDIWHALRLQTSIGERITYGQLGKLAYPDRRNLARPVGQAMRRNPVPIVVPCHRVILSTGELGNYNGGKENNVKVMLLQHERDCQLD